MNRIAADYTIGASTKATNTIVDALGVSTQTIHTEQVLTSRVDLSTVTTGLALKFDKTGGTVSGGVSASSITVSGTVITSTGLVTNYVGIVSSMSIPGTVITSTGLSSTLLTTANGINFPASGLMFQLNEGSDSLGHIGMGGIAPSNFHAILSREGAIFGHNVSGNSYAGSNILGFETDTLPRAIFGNTAAGGRAYYLDSNTGGNLTLGESGQYGTVDGIGDIVIWDHSGSMGVKVSSAHATFDVGGNAQFGQFAKSTFTAFGSLQVPYGIAVGSITASSTGTFLAVGLGTTTPVVPFTLVDTRAGGFGTEQTASASNIVTSMFWRPSGGNIFHVRGSTDSTTAITSQISVETISPNPASVIDIITSSGTLGAGRAIIGTASRSLGVINWRTWTSGTTNTSLGRIGVFTEGIPGSASNIPTYMQFNTSSTGTISGTEAMRITANHSVSIGAADTGQAMLVVKSSASNTTNTLFQDSSGVTVMQVPSSSGGLFTLASTTFTVAATGIISAPSQPAASVNTLSSLATPAGAVTTMYWTNTNKNNQNMFGGASSSGTLTVPVGGAGGYVINCTLPYSASAAASVRVRITAGGSDYDCYGTTNVTNIVSVSCPLMLQLADSATIVCKAFSASAQAFASGLEGTFSAVKVY